LTIIGLLGACSSSVDTATMTADEHFNYAKSLYDDEDYLDAITEFQAILLQYPGSSVNDDAQFYLGMSYYNEEQYILAAYEFSKLIREIPASPFVSEAQFMLADSYYQLSPDYRLDQVYTEKALKEFQAYIDFFPTSPKVKEAEAKIEELHNKLAHKEYSIAVLYEKMDYYFAAIEYYTSVLDTYYDTEYAPKALLGRIKTHLRLHDKKSAEKDIRMFFKRYPDRKDELAEVEEIIKKNFPDEDFNESY
jgi:outer membrane protein assembly factor BamD